MKKQETIDVTRIVRSALRRTLMMFVLLVAFNLQSDAQKPLNESDVRDRIMQRKNMDGYREGTPWTDDDLYVNTVEYDGYSPGHYGGYGCYGFMMDMMEYASNYEYPIRIIYGSYDNLPQIRIGDGVRVNNNGHSVVVIDKNDNGHEITVVEGNYNRSVHWGRKIDLADPKAGFTYISTFWPETPTDIASMEADSFRRNILIYNLSGMVVKNLPQTEQPVQEVLRELPQGTYIVKEGTRTYKVFNRE